MAWIYCISNDINDKKYVGKTTKSIDKRLREHIRDSRKEECSNRPLYRSIRKYGEDRFKIEILEECSELDLDLLEIFWIKKLNTYEYGYNATLGGDGKILFDYQYITEVYNSGLLIKEVAIKCNCSIDTVRKILNLYNIDTQSNAIKARSKRIKQFSLKGEYITTFSSTMEAIKWCYENGYSKNASTGNSSHLGRCANGKSKTAYKFKWEWDNIEESIVE